MFFLHYADIPTTHLGLDLYAFFVILMTVRMRIVYNEIVVGCFVLRFSETKTLISVFQFDN